MAHDYGDEGLATLRVVTEDEPTMQVARARYALGEHALELMDVLVDHVTEMRTTRSGCIAWLRVADAPRYVVGVNPRHALELARQRIRDRRQQPRSVA
ncbi:MAG TPA: hypothetical protein VFQ22_07720 [Longimicrobiales bacterium]|nr:hypothetical protein [Longimicrobiales bacterium]